MSKELTIFTGRYMMNFFSDRPGIYINETQYEAIKNNANAMKFVEIDGNLHNLSDVKHISKIMGEPINPPIIRNDGVIFRYASTEEFEQASNQGKVIKREDKWYEL